MELKVFGTARWTCPSPSGPRARCWRGRRPRAADWKDICCTVGAVELGDPLAPADPEVSLRICYAQPGEELFAIARRYHVSPGQMLAANDLPDGTTRLDEARRPVAKGLCRGETADLRRLWRHLSQRERPWQAGPLPTEHLRPDMAQKGGRCYRGQRLLNKRTLSRCRWPRQRSTTVPETSCFDCPA